MFEHPYSQVPACCSSDGRSSGTTQRRRRWLPSCCGCRCLESLVFESELSIAHCCRILFQLGSTHRCMIFNSLGKRVHAHTLQL